MKGAHRDAAMRSIDPDLLLRAYSVGVFPMAESRDSPEIFWVEPRRRGVLPLHGFHLSRSLARTLRRDSFAVTVDRAFDRVVASCAEVTGSRTDTWINGAIERAYAVLHARGHAHSVEVWRPGDVGGELLGGLYGVTLGAAFFGESMFSRATDTSKTALAHLVARMRVGGYRLLDCQFITDHLASLGAIEIDRDAYKGLLDEALAAGGAFAPGGGLLASLGVDFFALDRVAASEESGTVSGPVSGRVIAQLLGHTS